MKLLSVVLKCLREQFRSFWILLLSLSMGPFFILIYFLIAEASEPHYKILVINSDSGIIENDNLMNQGENLISYLAYPARDTISTLLNFIETKERSIAIDLLKNKKADALIVIPETFSRSLNSFEKGDSTVVPELEFIGDLTNTNYLISAVWAGELVNEFALEATKTNRLIAVKEIPLGISAKVSYFDMAVPGILIVSLIMLMFTASIAFVSEVENKTILRLKLSRLSSFEFLGGIGIVQLLVGIISVLLTVLTAFFLGFKYQGSFGIMLFISGLTSLSIIAFSLIIASVTKSANEVLVVGNFPMFLFMFFTGAAFPINGQTLFTVAGYPVTIQGLMTPTHALSALNKTLIMDMNFMSIIPEIIAIIILSLLYFIIGAFIFKRRHLKLT